uniref:Replication factor C subunit 4 n=1 Tax=Nosema pernyi TaxID=1112939 RepID=A0A0N7ADL1_9MICR|nr:replication factor C subunit 4 [Nosema pernyi]
MNQLWTEKYRPKSETEFEGQPHVKRLLNSSLLRDHPNLLLYGPPGTGKTTFAHLISKDKLELNASDERGIGVIRDKIKGYAQTVNFKTVILDECENLTDDAQHCLRRIIEDCKNTRFIFITNYLSKIISPLISRLVKVKFQISSNFLLERIGKNENLNLSHREYEKIFKFCNFDLRRSINVLQGIKPLINIKDDLIIEDIIGIVPLEDFKQVDSANYLNFINEFLLKGYSVLQLIHQLSDFSMRGTDKQKAEFNLGLSKMEEKLVVGCSEILVLTKICLLKIRIFEQKG